MVWSSVLCSHSQFSPTLPLFTLHVVVLRPSLAFCFPPDLRPSLVPSSPVLRPCLVLSSPVLRPILVLSSPVLCPSLVLSSLVLRPS